MFNYSIIIPVYNAEKFLNNCVESILNQTYQNYEIILVDDCSSDSSPEICDKLKNEHPKKIKVIRCKKNGGVANARNVGLENATGDYIGFMDNDDKWQFDYSLFEIDQKLSVSNADMLIYGTAIYNEQTGTIIEDQKKFKEQMIANQDCFQAVRTMIKYNFVNFTVWSKFVKRKIILENKIVFPSNKRNEDTDWLCKVFSKINSVDAYEKPLYLYRKGNEYSQTSKPLKREHVDDLRDILISNIDYATNLEEKRRDMIYDFLTYAYMVWLSQIAFFNETKEDIEKMKSRSFILKQGTKKYIKYVRFFISVFGIKSLISVLNFLLVKKYPHLKESGK